MLEFNLDNVTENDTAQEYEGFIIADDKAADWACKQILKERAERDRLTALADLEIEELQMRKGAIAKACDDKTSFLLNALNNYTRTQDEKATKTQATYKLLHAKTVRKFAKAQMVPDKTVLLEFLKANHPEFIKVTEAPDWAEYKKGLTITEDGLVVDADGVMVDGVTVEQNPESFDIKEA